MSQNINQFIWQVLIKCKIVFVRTEGMEIFRKNGITLHRKVLTFEGIQAQESCEKPAWKKEKRMKQMQPSDQ